MAAPRRRYRTFDPRAGYPGAPGLYYECRRCGGVTLSLPSEYWTCDCGNVHIDVDQGRFAVTDPAQVRLFELDGASDSRRAPR